MIKLLKAAVKTGSGTVGRLFFGILGTKIMAVVLGPAGIGLLSLLRQTRQTALTMATVSGNVALVQGIASRGITERNAYIRTVFCIILPLGALSCAVMSLFAPEIARAVLRRGDMEAVSLVRWLALPVFLGVLLMFFNGLLNGYRAIGRLAFVSVISTFVVALLAYPTAQLVNEGYLLAFIWMMTASVLSALAVAGYFLWREGWLASLLRGAVLGIQVQAARHFFSIAVTTLITGLAATGTLLVVRSMITQEQGLSGAGIFDVAWTLSIMYVGLVTASFGTYYLPTLSGITDPKERILLMRQLFYLATLLMVPVVVTVIVLKPLVVHLLYSSKFLPSLDIIRWMLIGDYLKVTSWVLAFPILAYADMRTFLWSELLWNGLFCMGTYFAVVQWGHLEGVGITFLLVYATYLIFTMIYCRVRHHFTLTRGMVWHWFAGLALVLPKNIWQYVVQIPRLAELGHKFVLQGGTQYNLAAVKAQVDYIRARVPGAEVRVHPHCGEAGAIGVALEARRQVVQRGQSCFIGLESAIHLEYTTRTDAGTRCSFCDNQCTRTFIDTRTPQGTTSRYIAGWYCEKGNVESDRKSVV